MSMKADSGSMHAFLQHKQSSGLSCQPAMAVLASTCWYETGSQSLLFTCTVCVSVFYITEAATLSARRSMTCYCTDFPNTCIASTQHQAVVIIGDEQSAENSNISQRELRSAT